MNKSQIPPQIFDRNRLRLHRNRVADNFQKHDFLWHEMAKRLLERLEFINRKFPLALDLGAKNGVVAEELQGRGGIETLVQAEFSENLIRKANGIKIVADEELLPFADNSFDLVISAGSLHWVNDLKGTLIQIQRILKPDGLFLCATFGGKTLHELRASFEQAEIEQKGGISPRISPFIEVRDGGKLLQNAGFSLCVADSEMITTEYTHPLKLMRELRGMGEANALYESSKSFTPCSLMMLAVDNYIKDFSNEFERVTASFEMVTLTGWKPHSSQQQPARRGSGVVDLNKVL